MTSWTTPAREFLEQRLTVHRGRLAADGAEAIADQSTFGSSISRATCDDRVASALSSPAAWSCFIAATRRRQGTADMEARFAIRSLVASSASVVERSTTALRELLSRSRCRSAFLIVRSAFRR